MENKEIVALLIISNNKDANLVSNLLNEIGVISLRYNSDNHLKLNTEQFDLIICDSTPDLTTKKFIQSHKDKNLSFLPVLLLVKSNTDKPYLNENCFDDIIRIPISKSEFKTRILTFLKLRKQAEQIRLNNEQRYKTIFEATGTATLISDKDTRILMANNECSTIFGYSNTELVGQSWTNFAAPETRDLMLKNHNLRRKNNKAAPQKYEVKILHKNGKTLDVILEVAMIPNTEESVVSMLDVSELINKEKALEKSNQLFNSLLNALDDVYWRASLDGSEIFEVSPNFKDIYGFETKELINKPQLWFECIHPDDVEYAKSESSKLMQNENIEIQYRIICPDGTIKWISDRKSVIKNKQNTPVYIAGIARDITHQIQRIQNIKELNKKLKDTLESITDAVAMFDSEMNYTFVNTKAQELLGYSEEMLIGKNYFELFPEARESEFAKSYLEVLETKQARVLEEFYEPWNRWFENRIYPTTDGIVVYFSETTEKIKSQQLIRTLSKAIEQSSLSIIVTNSKGEIEYVNDKFEKTSQFTLDNVKNTTPNVFKSGFLKPETQKKLWDNLNELKIWKGIVNNVKKDGSNYFEDVTISAIVDREKKLSNYVILKEDVTEKLKFEEQIKLLSKSVDYSPVSVIITDPDGTIVYVNKRFEENTGYSVKEVIGKNPNLLKSGYHENNFYKQLWDTIKKGEIWQGEIRNKRKTGELYWDNIIISPIYSSENTITHFVSVQEDITQKKILENELIAAKEKAEESERLKTAFLHNLSHEIRTPMNGITGFSNLLTKENLSEDNRKKYTDIIVQSSKQLLNIIEDIIRIATIEVGQEKIYLEKTNANSLINLVYEQNQVTLQNKNIEFEKYLSDVHENVFFESDQGKILQILNNFITNAIKFTDEGSIKIGYNLKDNLIEFYVTDTGIGIPKTMHQHIFKRFRQVDEGYTRQYGGSGLGLAISKAYVDLLVGTIGLDSEPEKGSTFYFTIPFNKIDIINSNNTKNQESINKLNEKQLLVAEDEDYNYMLIEEIFSDTNVTIMRAQNGQEAINLVKENPNFNLILMDIKMPVMNGLEATKEIKKLKYDVPIIALTAYANSEDRKNALNSGCNDYIVKPVDKDKLINLVYKYI